MQATRNTGGTTQTHIDIGHFLASVFTRAVDRGTGFADNYFINGFTVGWRLGLAVFFQQFNEFTRQLVRLPTGGSVANRNQIHAVLFAQSGKGVERTIPVFARLMRIHGRRFYELSGGIYYGHFDAGTNARVKAHHHTWSGWCSQQ